MGKIIFFSMAFISLVFATGSFAIQAEIPASIPSNGTKSVARGGTQVTIGGEIRVRGGNAQNTSDFNRNDSAGGTFVAAEKQGKGK